MAKKTRAERRESRHLRVRRKVQGTGERPRLNVFRSLNHIYVQVIDDNAGHTICAASTLSPDLKEKVKGLKKREQAKLVGLKIAELCKEKNITSVVFDRGGYKYHGRVAALAEGAREGGLEF